MAHKSERFFYELRPDWERADKQERKQLRKIHRAQTKEQLKGLKKEVRGNE